MARADKDPDGKDMCFFEKWIVGCPPPFSFLFVFVFQLRQVRWEESRGCSTPAFRIPGCSLLHRLCSLNPQGIPSSRLNMSQKTAGVVLWGKVSSLLLISFLNSFHLFFFLLFQRVFYIQRGFFFISNKNTSVCVYINFLILLFCCIYLQLFLAYRRVDWIWWARDWWLNIIWESTSHKKPEK